MPEFWPKNFGDPFLKMVRNPGRVCFTSKYYGTAIRTSMCVTTHIDVHMSRRSYVLCDNNKECCYDTVIQQQIREMKVKVRKPE